ncbi:unnamed protein product [Lepidochelys kempii]
MGTKPDEKKDGKRAFSSHPFLLPGVRDRGERRVIEMGKDKKYQGRVITRYILGSEGQEQASGQPVTVHDPLPAHWKESMEPGDQVKWYQYHFIIARLHSFS